MKRNDFIRTAALTAGAFASTGFHTIKKTGESCPDKKSPEIMTGGLVAISSDERKQRVAKAQGLLRQNKMQALILEGGSSMYYFTGISWWLSERTMVAVIPADGEIFYVCPAFEKDRLEELISIGNKTYVWQEDDSPYHQIADALRSAGIHSGTIGFEEQLRYFIADGIRKSAPELNYSSGDPITIPCRMFKSATELALMQKASDITVAAIKTGISHLKEGITASEISSVINKAQADLGAEPDFALILFGKASALPHGTVKSQFLGKGDIVLMDCGCKVEGYCSDITRTIVYGTEPTRRQLDIWALEQKAQAAGFSAAKIGAPCSEVDNAARRVITAAGFGPGYQLPGLPHRTGHGIGLDGHEWGNIVKGNPLKLQAGMCFSIEPTISIPGEFGVRLEDCVYMTESGPRWFSSPAISLSQPFA